MARTGVTEAQVHEAALALLLAGERPTIERLRAHLGTGSPNTLIRHLDHWWATLGRRLSEQAGRLAVPGAPPSVTAAASSLWEAALAAAGKQVAAELQARAHALETDRIDLVRQREALQEREATLGAEIDLSREATALAEARRAEIQALSQHQAAQIQDLASQRDSQASRLETVEADRRALAEELTRSRHAAERAEIEANAHLREVENRAYAEIDRLRQEVKHLRAHQTARDKEHAAALRESEALRRNAEVAMHNTQRQAAVVEARLQALASARVATNPTKSRPPTRRVTPRPKKAKA